MQTPPYTHPYTVPTHIRSQTHDPHTQPLLGTHVTIPPPRPEAKADVSTDRFSLQHRVDTLRRGCRSPTSDGCPQTLTYSLRLRLQLRTPPQAYVDRCTHMRTLPHSHTLSIVGARRWWSGSQPTGSASTLVCVASLGFPEELYPARPGPSSVGHSLCRFPNPSPGSLLWGQASRTVLSDRNIMQATYAILKFSSSYTRKGKK